MTIYETVKSFYNNGLNKMVRDMAKNSKTFTKIALGAIALGAAFTSANDANALDAGQCGPRAEIEATLRAEGQFPIVSGYRDIPSRPRNIFTSNLDGSLGYNVEGNQTELCIGLKYAGIRKNMNPDDARPEWAYIAPANSPFNNFLAREEQRINLRVIFGASGLVKGADGIERRAGLITVSQGDGDKNVTNQGAMVAANRSNGSFTVLVDLTNISINDRNLQQVASASSPTPTLIASVQPR